MKSIKIQRLLRLMAICLFCFSTTAFASSTTSTEPLPGRISTGATPGAQVLIVMGSTTDQPVMSETQKWLDWFGIKNDMRITSVHRTPDLVRSVIGSAEKQGYQVIIAGAGMAAHLPGMSSAQTSLPVLGVPLEGGLPGGVDALYSVVQMPAGLPVGTLAVGRAGARNAAVMAARIIALHDTKVAQRLELFKKNGYKFE